MNLSTVKLYWQPGGNILLSGNAPISKLIQKTTKSPWSHCVKMGFVYPNIYESTLEIQWKKELLL